MEKLFDISESEIFNGGPRYLPFWVRWGFMRYIIDKSHLLFIRYR